MNRFLVSPLFIAVAAAAGIAVAVAQSAVSAVQGIVIEQVGSNTLQTGEVPVFNQTSGAFERSIGPGPVMKWRPIGGDPASADFNLTRISQPFAAGRPPDEVMNWGYNINAGGGSERPGETALAWSIEGHYEPFPGTEYTEAHLHYVTKAGEQQRPFTIRINKNDAEDTFIGLNGAIRFRQGDGKRETGHIGPDNAAFYFRTAGGKGVQFADDGGTFQLIRMGGRGALQMSQGFDYAVLPGAIAHTQYFAVQGALVLANGGQMYTQPNRGLVYVSPTGRQTVIAPY